MRQEFDYPASLYIILILYDCENNITMQPNLKSFIERNIELIQDNNYTELYFKAKNQVPFQIGNLTHNLMLAGINPLDFLDRVIAEMFSNSMITEIVIPDNVTKINSQAFLDCFELRKITLPNTITSIHESAFKGCYELETIKFNGTVEQWERLKFKPATFYDVKTGIVECIDGEAMIPTYN